MAVVHVTDWPDDYVLDEPVTVCKSALHIMQLVDESRGNLAIHCSDGLYRSPAMVVALLVHNQRMLEKMQSYNQVENEDDDGEKDEEEKDEEPADESIQDNSANQTQNDEEQPKQANGGSMVINVIRSIRDMFWFGSGTQTDQQKNPPPWNGPCDDVIWACNISWMLDGCRFFRSMHSWNLYGKFVKPNLIFHKLSSGSESSACDCGCLLQ